MAPPDTAPQVLYVALDACDSALMQRLADAGLCPTFKALFDGAAVIPTQAPAGTFVGSSWMTITTGRDVEHHGYWNWHEVDPATYQLLAPTPRDARGRPFWEQLSDAGRRVAVLDVPHAAVPPSLNGVLLKEWGCHDRHDGTASFPAELLDELDRTIGRHPLGCRDHPHGAEAFSPCDYTLRDGPTRTLDEERQLVDLIRAGIDAKHRASLQVIEQGPWDLFATVLGEAHCVGHQFWHVHDDAHPRHDPAARRLLGDPVEDVYVRLDRVLGDLLARADDDTTVFVQMNHGMGPHFDGDHLLDQLLERIDESLRRRFEPGSWSRLGAAAYGATPAPLRRAARQGIAAAARLKSRRAPAARSARPGPSADRRFFQIPGNTAVGAVRFNIAGRESGGIVDPAELDALCTAVGEALLDVVDIDSGRPLVRSVVRSDTVLRRAADDRLPDLFVEWERGSQIERVWSPTTGTVVAPYEHWRTGDHHDRGVFVARGPGIVPGRRTDVMSLTDVAPTIAAALGVELQDVDGRARWDLVGAAGVRRARRDVVDARLDEAARRIADLEQRATMSEREHQIATTMAWLANQPRDDDVMVTVITPTHARPDRLAEAIRSVVDQRHQNWELIVVDDGSNSAAAVVDGFGDDRIRLVEIEHGGVCRARNVGLELAKGEIVTYLDDDNWLDPGWLHAIAWAFRNHPDDDVLYGVRVIDDVNRVHGLAPGGWPWLQFLPFDRAGLECGNLADMGVIAHRASCQARFDERLVECGDWDFLLALTEHVTPLELPAIAFYYRTDGTDRLTGQQPEDAPAVREKWARRRAAASAHQGTP